MAWFWIDSENESVPVDADGNVTHDPNKAVGYARLTPPSHRKPSRKKVLTSAKKAVQAAKRVMVRK